MWCSKTMSGVVMFGFLAAAGCADKGDKKGDQPPGATPGPVASATIEGRSGSSLTGNATFEPQKDGKILVRIQVQGATPGDHGVHVHEKGDCSDPEGKSAGGHFNPTGAAHGSPTAPAHHAGDFGNMTVKGDGTGILELPSGDISVGSAANSVVGRAIVVHEKADDLTGQPSGNSGARVGCGVINVAGAGQQAPIGQAPPAQ